MPPCGPPLVEMDDPELGRLTVPSEGTVVLLGPSGAGKTLLLRRLLGIGGAPAPRLHVRGRPRGSIAQITAWVPEGDGVFLSHTVIDNVAARIPGVGTTASPDDAGEALDLVGLSGRAADPVSSLSRNGRRRVALARALACRRPLLVVDGDLDATIAPLLRGLVAQVPWVEAVLRASAAASEETATLSGAGVALVWDGRVVAQAAWPELCESSDPDVRAALAWVSR